MDMAKRLEFEETLMEGLGPKGGTKWTWEADTAKPNILFQLVFHGLKRKIRDLFVDWHLQTEYDHSGGKRKPRDTDVVFKSKEEMRKAEAKAIEELFAELAKGNWGFAGGRAADPVTSELWVLLFKDGRIGGKDQSKARSIGMTQLAELIVQKREGKRLAKPELTLRAQEYLQEKRKRAEEIVALKTPDDSVDLSDVLK